MTWTPRLPKRAPRRGIAAAVIAGLSLLAGQVPASGQPQGAESPRACAGQDSDLRESCANLPLDDYRRRPPPPPPAPDRDLRASSDPLRPAAWRATLRTGVVGRAYGPVRLVEGGSLPYTVQHPRLPSSMRVSGDGHLVGLPRVGDAGAHTFTLFVVDAAGQKLQLNYRLQVVGERLRNPPPDPVVPDPPPPPQPTAIEGRMTVYVLRKADLDPPKPAPPAAAAETAPATAIAPAQTPAANAPLAPPPPSPPPPPPPEATRPATAAAKLPPLAPPPASIPADLGKRAAALRNIEYPSRDLFKHALRAQYAPGELSEEQLTLVADKAMEYRSFYTAPKLNWLPEAGCGCALPLALQTKEVYGFFPFWRSHEPPPSIIFSEVSRIGFLGAQLSTDGRRWIQPSSARLSESEWWAQTSRFARAAHAHGARLDLVLQRSDWSFLLELSPSQRRALYTTAARSAVDLADTPLQNRGASALLLPFWKEPRYVFDGITVMFDYPEDAGPEELRAYLEFHDGFIRQLILEMQTPKGKKKPREYTLHIVAPDPLDVTSAPLGVGSSAAANEFSIWRAFLTYKRLAEPASFHRAAPPEDKKLFLGRSDIRVRLIAPVREPTGSAKKTLRSSIDQLTDVRGYNRVAVLQSILPIVYLPAGDGPFREPPPGVKPKPRPNAAVPRTRAEKMQLDDDIIYYRQNFGGVALWPAPMQNVGIAKEVYGNLDRIFYQADSSPLRIVDLQPVCSLVLRLLWQAMALALTVALAAYYFWGQSSSRAPLFWRGLIGLGVAFVVLSGVQLTVDPALAEVSHSNVPLFGLMGAALGWAGWRAAKPRIPKP